MKLEKLNARIDEAGKAITLILKGMVLFSILSLLSQFLPFIQERPSFSSAVLIAMMTNVVVSSIYLFWLSFRIRKLTKERELVRKIQEQIQAAAAQNG